MFDTSIRYLEVDGEFYKCEKLENILSFTKNDRVFHSFVIRSIDALKRKRKLGNINVDQFIEDIGVNVPGTLLDSFISPSKILFDALITEIEKMYGEKFIKNSPTYQGVLDMQRVFRIIRDYYFNKGLPDFSSEQHQSSQRKLENFNDEVKKFKEYLKEL